MKEQEENLKARAKQLDREVRSSVKDIERGWVRLGKLCLECREHGLYNDLGFERFDDWIEDRVGKARSMVYQSIKAIAELEGEFSLSTIADMGLANAATLARVPKAKRKILAEKAKDQTAREFTKTVQDEAPEAHVEATQHFQVWLDGTVVKMAEDLMKRIEAKYGCSRAGAFEWLVETGRSALENEEEVNVSAENKGKISG